MWPKICQKLQGYKENWTERGTHPNFYYVDPPPPLTAAPKYDQQIGLKNIYIGMQFSLLPQYAHLVKTITEIFP